MKGKPKIATKKAKTTNNSISKDKATKNKAPVRVLEEYTNLINHEQQWITESALMALARELVDWARNDKEALSLGHFFAERGISRGVFQGWRERYPLFNEAMALALCFIAHRREAGAITKKYDASIIAFMQPHYSPEWKEQLDYRNAQKIAAQGVQGNVQVLITPFPETDVKRTEDKE